ncbi:MAG: hypothetical protein IIB16_01060 [Chloroflexi bacterium]|nr:hypothetical protein [Chloroflexota bacterium]
MAKEANLEFIIGESIEVTFTIVTGKIIRTTEIVLTSANSAAVEPLKEALADNDVLLFPNDVRMTLDAVAAIGATSLSFDALTGDIENRAKAQKVEDISSWTDLAARFKHQPGDANLVEKLQKDPLDITFVTDGIDGDAKFTLKRVDTKLFKAGLYVWDVWRDDSDNEAALIYGAVTVLQTPSQAPS